jgi:hypothetical protein
VAGSSSIRTVRVLSATAHARVGVTQGAGCLLVFDDAPVDPIYDTTVSTISNMSRVVDSLFVKSQKIVA